MMLRAPQAGATDDCFAIRKKTTTGSGADYANTSGTVTNMFSVNG
jgi:hypothetical protein